MNQSRGASGKLSLGYIAAKTVSYICIPPVLTVAIFVYLANKFEADSGKKFWVIFLSTLSGFILPITYFTVQRVRKKIVDNEASDRLERTIPYYFGVAFTLLGVISVYLLEVDLTIILVWISYCLTMIVLIPINKFWKISAHSLGAAIPVTAFLTVNNFEYFVALLLILVVGWARIQLKLHTISQVFAGSMLGFITTFILLKTFL